MKIRKLRKSEINLVCKIVEENYPSDIDDENLSKKCKAELKAMFVQSVIRPEYYVVEDKGEIMGFGGFFQSWMDYNVYEICWINIRPCYQLKNKGRFLVNELIKKIRKRKGARLIFLAAIVVDFYKKFGFEDLEIFDVGGYKLMYLDLNK